MQSFGYGYERAAEREAKRMTEDKFQSRDAEIHRLKADKAELLDALERIFNAIMNEPVPRNIAASAIARAKGEA